MSAEATAKVLPLGMSLQSLEDQIREKAAIDLRSKLMNAFRKLDEDLKAIGVDHFEWNAMMDMRKRLFDAHLVEWQQRAIDNAAKKLMES